MSEQAVTYELIKVPEIVYKHIMSLDSKHIGNLTETDNEDTIVQLNNKEKPLSVNLFKMSKKKVKHLMAFGEEKEFKAIDELGHCFSVNTEMSDNLTKMYVSDEAKNKAHVNISTSKTKSNSNAYLKISQLQYDNQNKDSKVAIMQQIRKEKNFKKTRKDKSELKKEIFDLFCEKQYWPKKDLYEILDQPDSFLKEVLDEMCVYIKGGPNKGCFELNDQYVGTENN